MVFNLNIVNLTIAITSWNKSYFIYIKNYCSIKLSTILLRQNSSDNNYKIR